MSYVNVATQANHISIKKKKFNFMTYNAVTESYNKKTNLIMIHINLVDTVRIIKYILASTSKTPHRAPESTNEMVHAICLHRDEIIGYLVFLLPFSLPIWRGFEFTEFSNCVICVALFLRWYVYSSFLWSVCGGGCGGCWLLACLIDWSIGFLSGSLSSFPCLCVYTKRCICA